MKWKTRIMAAVSVLFILVGSLTVAMAAPKKTDAAVKADALAIDLGMTAVISDISLPVIGKQGSDISWQSSDPEYISPEGKVTRPAAGDQKVTLTAEVSSAGVNETRTFEITVLENSEKGNLEYLNAIKESYELAFTTVYKDFVLPAETDGVVISWRSADHALRIANANQASVTRTAYGEGAREVILIASFSIGSQSVNKSFTVKVPEISWGYLLTYVNTEDENGLYLALSDNGSDYTALNRKKAVLYASERKHMSSPVIFRKSDGTYGVLSSLDGNDGDILLYDSEDLIHYTNERVISTNSNGITVTEPEVEFDIGIGAYRFYWKDGNGQGYMAVSEDLETFSEPEEAVYTKKTAAAQANLPEYAAEAGVLELTREEYEEVCDKYGVLRNTGIETDKNIKVVTGTEAELPGKVTAQYNDGSVKEMAVSWDTGSLDTNTEGNYAVKGTVSQNIYRSPFLENSEDPCIVYNEEDGYYYLLRSCPVTDSNEEGQVISGDELNIRRAESINDLTEAKEAVILEGIWIEEEVMDHRTLRMPQLYKINNQWHMIVYEGTDAGRQEELTVFTCSDGDLLNPESWSREGTVSAAADGEKLDGTAVTFIEKESQYCYVTLKDGSIYITDVDPDNLLQPTGSLVKLGTSVLNWEWDADTGKEQYESIAVMKYNNKVYIVYSGSVGGQSCYTGVLLADEKADLLNPDSWTKVPYPLLTESDLLDEQDQFVTRASSFFTDRNGYQNVLYHTGTNSKGNEDKIIQAKSINFAADGTPVLHMTAQEELADEYKNVVIMVEAASAVTVKYMAETGGTIQGETLQTIVKSGSTTEVTAAAAAGYTFIKWSDGITTEKRSDQNVTESKIVTAQFSQTAAEDSSVSQIAVSNEAITMGVKERFKVRVLTDSGEPVQKAEWSSDMESVAVVSSDGEITAKKKGTAVITAKASNGMTASCEVTVLKAPKKVTAEPVEYTLQNGSMIQLEISLPEDTASNHIIYTSSDETVAGVSSKGKVTAKKRGTTTITVETFNGRKAEVEITVK